MVKNSTKKTILIVISSCAGLLLLVALGWYIWFSSQFGGYLDSKYKFLIEVPIAWKGFVHPRANVAVVLMRPKDTALDTIQENFSVTIQQVPSETPNLDSFNATVKNQLTALFGKSIKFVVDKPMEWDWRQGHEIVIEEQAPNHLIMVNAWVIRGDQAYILTFFGDKNKYSQDKPYVDRIIHSLRLM